MTVEYGDFFEGIDKLDQLRVQTYIKLLDKANYDAISIDPSSFTMGYDFFTKQIETASVPFVSLNARNKTTGDFLDQPFVIKDTGGFRVAIIGLTGETIAAGAQEKSDFPNHAMRHQVHKDFHPLLCGRHEKYSANPCLF